MHAWCVWDTCAMVCVKKSDANLWNWFSASTFTWVLGIELRSSGMHIHTLPNEPLFDPAFIDYNSVYTLKINHKTLSTLINNPTDSPRGIRIPGKVLSGPRILAIGMSPSSISAPLEWPVRSLPRTTCGINIVKYLSAWTHAASDSMTPRQTRLCPSFRKNNVTTRDWFLAFSASVISSWPGNELFRWLVADSLHKLQEEDQQGNRWHWFPPWHSLSDCHFLSLYLFPPLSRLLQIKIPLCNSLYGVAMNYTCTFWSLMKVFPSY